MPVFVPANGAQNSFRVSSIEKQANSGRKVGSAHVVVAGKKFNDLCFSVGPNLLATK